jgi:hypothetical protein
MTPITSPAAAPVSSPAPDAATATTRPPARLAAACRLGARARRDGDDVEGLAAPDNLLRLSLRFFTFARVHLAAEGPPAREAATLAIAGELLWGRLWKAP